MRSEAIRKAIRFTEESEYPKPPALAEYVQIRDAAEAELAALEAENEQLGKTWDAALRGDCSTDEERQIFQSIFGPPEEDKHIDELSGTVLVDREELREIEWASLNEDGEDCCPACGGERAEGHADNCWLGALLEERG
ncbi:MAG: hypothetical protein U9Q31_01195 [Chloroflexota bacterium]|nr:hypothetical protein [Chloroflexota bacterium]